MTTLVAILAILLFAFTQAATITLPVTQDFAVVNQDRVQSVIARDDTITLFNNGLTSSISYFGVDTHPFIQEASLTTNSPINGMIESAELIFNNFSIISEQVGAINIQISFLNPGQVWSEDAVSLSTTPTIFGTLGTVDFSKARPSLDVTDFMVQALSGSYQGGLFGFHIGMPGGPVIVPSHRSDPDAIVVEIIYSPVVGPGVTAPPTDSTTSTTTTAAPTTSTAAPTTTTSTRYCWTCGAGWTHWYNIPGQAQPNNDPCACVRIPSSTTTAQPQPGTPSTGASPATTTTGSPQAPQTSGAPSSSSTGASGTTTAVPNSPERNSAVKMSLSAVALGVLIALWL